MTTTTLLNAATSATTGVAHSFDDNRTATFQAYGTMSSGSGTASISIQASNNGSSWLTLGTISLTLGTTETNDGFAVYAPWAFVRAKLDSITVNGTVTVLMGV